MHRARALAALALAALCLPLAACELTEVTAAPGEDLLVVDAVLRAGGGPHLVIVHHAVAGTIVGGEPGARVVLTTPEGREVAFQEASLAACAGRLGPGAVDSLTVLASCYRGPTDLVVRPGGTYELRVSAVDGRTLRGRTTVPGAFDLREPRLGAAACRLPARTNLPVVWSAAPGAWAYLATIEVDGMKAALQGTGIEAKDRMELTGLTISERDTTIVLPRQFGLFELGNLDEALVRYLQDGFPAGVIVRLVVAAADRNYVNGVRGGNFNPSGTTRISSMVGDGVGVFGSLADRELNVVVADSGSLPPCLPG